MLARGSVWLGCALALGAAGCSDVVEALAPPEVVLEAPDSVDLGWMPRDAVAEATFSVRNVGPSPVGLEAVVPQAASRTVEVTAELDRTTVRPLEVAQVTVRAFAGPSAAGELTIPLLVRVAGLPEDDPRQPIVDAWVRVSPSGLVAEPNPLSIGPVLYLATGSGAVAIRNLNPSAVEVFARDHEGGRARYLEAVTRGAFGPLPEVDGLGRLFALGPGEARIVDIEYTAPDEPGEAKEQAIWRVASCLDDPDCGLEIVVQGVPDDEAQRLAVSPSGVHFGPTPVGAPVTRSLTISNAGQRPLEVSDFVLEGSREFSAPLPEDETLAPGESLQVSFRYTPTDEGLDNANLIFDTNDPLETTAAIRVTGSGVILPPCRVRLRPGALDFGAVPVFEARRREVTVINEGEEACLLFDPRIVPDTGAFVLDPDAPGSVTLEPGADVTYGVSFAPGTPGSYEAALVIRSSGAEPVEIPLRGNTPEGVRLSCVSDVTVTVGAPAALTAALSAASTARSYRWSVLSGPTVGGEFPVTFRPDDRAGPQVQLVPQALGVYEVRAEVETTDDEILTCQTQVTAVGGGLTATLTWDGPGDLDLHLHRGQNTPWFGADDCHFDNQTPIWVPGEPTASGPNPFLDRDDTSGDGPETIRLAEPMLAQTYTLAVGHFERAAGRTARVELFCGRATTRIDATSRPFRGNETGNCTRNDFWEVARVVFIAPDDCLVTMLDEYRTTAEACAAF